MTFENPKLIELKQEYRWQIERIRHEEDGDERERQFKKLEDVIEAMFAIDMQTRHAELEQQAAKHEELCESYESRKAQRETIIKAKLNQVIAAYKEETLLTESRDSVSEAPDGEHDGLFVISDMKTAGAQVEIVSDKTEDGNRRMKIYAALYRPETRSRAVGVYVESEQTLSRVIDGKQFESKVAVPEGRVTTKTYVVQVPITKVFEIDVPQGEHWVETARKKLARDRSELQRRGLIPRPDDGKFKKR